MAAAQPWTSAAAAAVAAAAAAAGGGVALALLRLCWGRAADALTRAVPSWPRAAGGGHRRSLCLARVGVRPLTRWLALHARGPG